MSVENPSRNAMLDDLVGLLEICSRYAVCCGLCEHFISDIHHLQSVAIANKEQTRQ